MGTMGNPETSVGNYHYSLHNNPEEGSSFLLNVLYVEYSRFYSLILGFGSSNPMMCWFHSVNNLRPVLLGTTVVDLTFDNEY
jgi:hypothetical protein